MHYGIDTTLEGNECLVIGVFSNNKIASEQYENNGLIKELALKLDKNNPTIISYKPDTLSIDSLLLIHCGKEEQFNDTAFFKAMSTVSNQLKKMPIKSALVCLPKINDVNWQTTQSILHFEYHLYNFNDFKSKKDDEPALKSINFAIENVDENIIEQAIARAAGIQLARNLGNMPANFCTPSYLAESALKLASQHEAIETKIIDKQEMQELGMGALLAVAKGSAEAPKLIELAYHGGQNQAPIVLVGKGITFDSGGITLKPGNGMDEMKFDMCGAASVFGVIKAIAQMKLPINVIGLVAAAENLPSSTAVKPGDVITTHSGQTVEIINTDAEGRLVLCDALSYAKDYKPQFILDIATLTGAMVVALGEHNTGFMTIDDELADKLMDASKESCDKLWRMPLEDDYQDALDSPVADFVNATFNRSAGSITAACYLSKFTQGMRWAHLDIAGTAWVSGKNRCATGRPVALLTQFLINHAH
jgi:leucyl aminopeptidase